MENMKSTEVQNRRIRRLRIAALVSYFVGYFYARYCFFDWGRTGRGSGISYLIFTLLFIACVEILSFFLDWGPARVRSAGRGASLTDAWFCAACAALQALALAIWGAHAETLTGTQLFMWHFTLIYYVFARTGMLAAGRTGILFPVDSCVALFYLPWANLLQRVKCLWKREIREGAAVSKAESVPEDRTESAPAGETGSNPDGGAETAAASGTSSEEGKAKQQKMASQIAIALVTIFIAVIVCAIAAVQLAGVSSSFASLGAGITEFFRRMFSGNFADWFVSDFLPYFLFSIPISAWLFGLAFGGLKREYRPVVSYEDVSRGLRGVHVFPAVSAYIVIGALLAVYAIFFLVSAGELAGLLHVSQAELNIVREAKKAAGETAITAPQAMQLAVEGFWQLVRIVVLNFAVLGIFTLLSDVPLWERKGTRILVTVLFLFATAFALIAGWKLYVIYIGLFGPTPRRILSGWVLAVLLLWCVLVLVRLWRRIPAVRIGILAAAASFSVLMMFNIEGITGITDIW